MDVSLLLVTFLLTGILQCEADVPAYKTLYFEQNVDHFNYANQQTFQQRYLVADDYWRNSESLFFYTGNEGPIEEFYNNSGLVFELANMFSALVVFAEHRYYGKTLPFGDKSFDKDNIGYLSAEQALADFAVLTQKLKMDYKIKKTVAFGGSYGGMLSAWMRFKYPNVIDGALAASAPIYMVADLIDPGAFFQKVTEDFSSANEKCPDIVRGAFERIRHLNTTGNPGLSEITSTMKLCNPLTKDKVEHLIGWVRNSFTIIAMLDYPYPASFIASLPANPVKASCDILLNAKDELTGLADAAGIIHLKLSYTDNTVKLIEGQSESLLYGGSNYRSRSCNDIEKEFIECADPTGCGLGNDALAWDYQACTEMVLRCETNNVTDMFPPMKYDVTEYCKSKWGVAHRPGWMAAQYWGKNISSATNIIFSNGNLDPWSVGGVLKGDDTNGQDILPLMVEGGAHHLDLRSSNPKDPQTVIDIRILEAGVIAEWIS